VRSRDTINGNIFKVNVEEESLEKIDNLFTPAIKF
jgi:hypothetical protein